MKRMKREERGNRPPYVWYTRWVVYESEAKKAIEKAYEQGRADAIRDAQSNATQPCTPWKPVRSSERRLWG